MSGEDRVVVSQGGSVDWLTCTSVSERVGYDWYDLFYRYQREWAERRGHSPMVRNASRHGYHGRQGEGMFYGLHDKQGYMLVAWGEASDVVWPKSAPAAKNITRLDLAVTVELQDADPNLAKNAYQGQNKPGQRGYTYIENSKGGRTLYIGSRQSSQYARLYDKGVKDLGLAPGVCWRYEVEFKDKALNQALLKSMYKLWQQHGVIGPDVTSYVHQWFYVRGVRPRFSALGRGLPKPEIEATVSTAEKKLRWLSAQVAPTVQELIRVGLGDRALLALGLEKDQLPLFDQTKIDVDGSEK